MKFFNKLAKGGIFCDSRCEHATLVQMSKQNKLQEFLEKGGFRLDIVYYHTPLTVDVAEYEDGIVRLIAYCCEFEVGRILVPVADFKNNVQFYTDNKKEK